MIAGKRHGPPWFWWAVHNLLAHPASELLYWARLERWSYWVHDETVPIHDTDSEGRG